MSMIYDFYIAVIIKVFILNY